MISVFILSGNVTPMNQVKATNTVTLKKIIQKRGEAFEAQYFKLLTSHAVLRYNCLLASAWIDIEEEKTYMDAGVKLLFPDHPQPMIQLGQLLANETLTGLYKVFLRIPTITFLLSRADAVWKRFNRQGRLEVENLEKHSGILVVKEHEEFQLFQADLVSGYLHAGLRIVGAKNVSVHFDGHDPKAWRWSVTWD